ncbi:hypothetical protein Glove_279g46 [Diversispora epigaea]|uniref:Uncharacterized protein n=1 Tax=Diversispora epigaea TaxID=1348612 RepID=A0A397IAA1_9GLOM|nr:hypothetical protein Glove_279g46 [Diversispora epigaea]
MNNHMENNILETDATTTDTFDEREKKSSKFKKLIRETFHNSIKFLLDLLFTNDDDDGDGIELKIDNEIFWFFPKVSTIICDWPEMILRNKENMLQYYNNGITEKANLLFTNDDDDGDGIELKIDNEIFWFFPKVSTIICDWPEMILRNKENMLQYYNNGITEKASLYRYQIEFTKKLLFEVEGRSLVDKMNWRITLIPRHPELKIFSGGLQSIALLTADNYRNIMKVMVFVVDDLLNKDLSEVYVKWNEIYLLSRQETFKESDLKNFQEAIEKWVNLFIKLFAINGYTTETYEALHKTYVKIPYCLSNKKDVEEQIMKTIRRKAIIKQNDFKKKFKTPLKFNYSSKLFEFDISEAFEFINKYKNETNLDEKMIKGLNHFIQSLNSYFDLLKISTAQGCHIKIYRSITLKNRAILRTINMFHKRPWFSNISVTMNDEKLFEYQSDNGICYIQTLLITDVFLKKEKSLHLAFVYNFIEIETIEDIVHIVPRFDKTNEYLRPWFSNISVTMNDEKLFEYQSDNGICYIQTLLITDVFLKKEKSLHLAFVYNFIEIETIEDIVHIVPRFDKTNEYLDCKQFALSTTPITPAATTLHQEIFYVGEEIKKKKDEFYSGLLTGKSKFVKKDCKQFALSTTPITPAATTLHQEIFYVGAATTPTPTIPTTLTTPTMLIVLIESEEVAEASSRKKQKTVAGAIKNYYSDERKISDIRKLLASSGIELDYTIENEFINKFVWKVANSTIDKRIYSDESYLKSVAAEVKKTNVGALITQNIFKALLRESIANRVRVALFAVFEEHELPYIDTKSASQEIKEWKDLEKLKNAYDTG